MSNDSEPTADACPVDPATRAAWLKANPKVTNWPGLPTPAKAPPPAPEPPTPAPSPGRRSWFSWLWAPAAPAAAPPAPAAGLSVDREISTIPRAAASVGDGHAAAAPANHEIESGASAKGNWIYPSEKMFFDAMTRKGHSPQQTDMRTIVPIHNAVNERAWKEIKAWEQPYGADKCGGPRLHSFLGLSTSLTPRARFNSLMGYSAPFDRHDWVVDRCGTTVEYVIDFYAGKDDGSGKLNFFLDVRPKLNSWEGVKMRAFRAVGLV